MHAIQRRRGVSLIEILVVFSVTAILIGVLLPAVQNARAAAIRSACRANLRQCALAVHLYHDEYGFFPVGHTPDHADADYPHLCWQARLLPALEQTAVWQEAVAAYATQRNPFGRRGRQPAHPGFAQIIPTFLCPGDPRDLKQQFHHPVGEYLVALTSYLGIAGTTCVQADGVLIKNQAIRTLDVVDGLSTTLLIGERPPSFDHRYGWWYAGAGMDRAGKADAIMGVAEIGSADPYFAGCPLGVYRFQAGNPKSACSIQHYWSTHQGGGHFALADGSVQFFNYSAAEVLAALATRAGGESAELP
jgi:prepilin-type processing-associated H-X9-DG protein